MGLDFQRIWPSVPYILDGIYVTLGYTGASLCLGFVLGALLALCKMSRCWAVRAAAQFYTSIFRGTPLLVQLMLIYHATPQVFGYNISVWEAGILSFTLNSTAYLSEHFRAGITSIDRGQLEAALALGVPHRLAMRDIILPQAFRVTLPSLVNESIDLLKESALISIIGGADILRRATIVANEKYLFFEPFLIAAGIYYVLILILTSLMHRLEKKLRYDRT